MVSPLLDSLTTVLTLTPLPSRWAAIHLVGALLDRQNLEPEAIPVIIHNLDQEYWIEDLGFHPEDIFQIRGGENPLGRMVRALQRMDTPDYTLMVVQNKPQREDWIDKALHLWEAFPPPLSMVDRLKAWKKELGKLSLALHDGVLPLMDPETGNWHFQDGMIHEALPFQASLSVHPPLTLPQWVVALPVHGMGACLWGKEGKRKIHVEGTGSPSEVRHFLTHTHAPVAFRVNLPTVMDLSYWKEPVEPFISELTFGLALPITILRHLQRAKVGEWIVVVESPKICHLWRIDG